MKVLNIKRASSLSLSRK